MPTMEMSAKRLSGPLFESLATPARQGTVQLHWLGQAGFAIRSFHTLALIDPYLSNSLAEKYKDAHFKHIRMMKPPIRPDEIRGVNFLFATHAHSDHLDPGGVGQIMAVNPGCLLICPKSANETALARGADRDRIRNIPLLEKWDFGPISVEMLPSAHEELKDDGHGNTLFAGFIIEIGGIRLYHSGDCVPYDGLDRLLAERGIDVALLPVNGRDAERTAQGVLGNFTVEEAADLCVKADIGFLVAHHFGMFDFNTVDPAEADERLKAAAGGVLRWIIPSTDTCITISD